MDATFQLLWQRYRAWADTSRRLKNTNASWKRYVLVLTIMGTALATLGPFAGVAGQLVGWVLPVLGAAALTIATYLGKELLDTKHEEAWTRARAAAEVYKSEANKYLVQARPYAGPDREAQLRARIAQLAAVGKGLAPDAPIGNSATKGMPTAFWSVDDYIKNRIDDQVKYYRDRAQDHTDSMVKGRQLALLLGGLAALLSLVTGATPQGAKFVAAVLGVVTTAGGAIGAHFQAGHFEAIALKYRETGGRPRPLEARPESGPDARESQRAHREGRDDPAGRERGMASGGDAEARVGVGPSCRCRSATTMNAGRPASPGAVGLTAIAALMSE